ncbi:PMT6 [[Candida] subhashii]|uniref:Dolichyl-phosphate-mannose--protein mannosyltransferase n=1 Tax=[Candida] subhashii TaxID=561895 RepID=A0A8J5UJK5_9ASCO|nr:PMT6 [[Candida] subhashii]KAG7661772.1 PMT6 [[Candida] subhashii]
MSGNTSASGVLLRSNGEELSHRVKRHPQAPSGTSLTDSDLDEIIEKTSNLDINGSGNLNKLYPIFTQYITPLILTALSAYVRLYRIELANRVVWDEAHFGQFGSHYLQHEMYFDVHPPLGKLLVGLSGYLAGYDGKFDFNSGKDYPEDMNYVLMRIFNCVFGILCTPLAYKTSTLEYITHWVVRIIALIVVPISIYMVVFKIHFTVLNHTGPDDGSISTLLQASLKGNDLISGPRTVVYGSLVTIRSQGLSPRLLHSHLHNYPEGSGEQQVTTYGFKDENNEFVFEFDVSTAMSGVSAGRDCLNNETVTETTDCRKPIQDGDTIRIRHGPTGLYLHPNALPAPVSKSHYEVSCFGDLATNDFRDEWIIEVQAQDQSPSPLFANESMEEVHPISTNFRLRHKQLGCYLATTGFSYPGWGFKQGEVVCNHLDKVEQEFVPPSPRFWKEFVLLNYGMMASNNALVPDPDRYDKLSSEWWEWPILKTGLRMCSWGADDLKFFLMGNPFVTWLSCVCLVLFMMYMLKMCFEYQRQISGLHVFDTSWNNVIGQGILPFIGWCLHYFPFIIMGRVTYLHHYVPALYFAIFVSGFVVEQIQSRFPKSIRYLFYLLLYVGVIGTFWHFRAFSFGMEGSAKNYQHLKLLKTWLI